MVSNAVNIITSLPTTMINWPQPSELLEAGGSAVRLIAKGELLGLLHSSTSQFERWIRDAKKCGLELILDLPGSRPIVASKEFGNDFRPGQEVTFIDETAPYLQSDQTTKQVRLKHFTNAADQTAVGDRLTIADNACVFRVIWIGTSRIKAICESSSAVDLFARGISFRGLSTMYTSPTDSEKTLLASADISLFSAVIVSFARTPVRLQLRSG